jgi:hypothetical protein
MSEPLRTFVIDAMARKMVFDGPPKRWNPDSESLPYRPASPAVESQEDEDEQA